MFERHGIIMTVGVYAIATGANKRTELQNAVMQTLGRHDDITQVHGFYYFERENRVSIDVVPDISVHDEPVFKRHLEEDLKAVLPDTNVSVVIDHNYSA